MSRVLSAFFLVTLLGAAGCGEAPARPSPVQNAGPTVAVAFQGASSCTPPAGGDCTLPVVAQATDPDSDALTYTWTGCASGTAADAICMVRATGAVTATVTVSDGHGHVATASASGEGTTAPNSAPAVTVSLDGSDDCVPLPNKPCTLRVVAQASDPDGDPLSYSWSQCAMGSADRATCTVQRPGSIEASVAVDDGHGHKVTASATVIGRNNPPGVQIGYVFALPGDDTFELLGNVIDPDEGTLCGREYCTSVSASGACGAPVALDCSCLGGLVVDVKRTAATGTCKVTINVKDSWGQPASRTIDFSVVHPAAP